MAVRLKAFALAFVMIGAPVVTTTCQAICAARDSGPNPMGEHHSCHHEPPDSHGPAVNGAAHACGHSDEAPNVIDQTMQAFAAPAITVSTFSLTASMAQGPRLRSNRIEHSPPGLLGLNTQLRV